MKVLPEPVGCRLRHTVFFILLAPFAAGCMHVKSIDGTNTDTIYHLNRATQHTTVLVHFNDGSYTYAEDLNVGPITTYWNEPNSQRSVYVPTSDIFEIHVRDRTNGMFDGLGLGILAGASMGMIAGLSLRSSDPESIDPESQTASAGLVGGMVVGSLGMLIGTTRGATQCYRFRNTNPPRTADVRPSRPR